MSLTKRQNVWVRKTLEGVHPDRLQGIDLNNFKLYKPGVHADAPFGFKGRIVIAEEML